MKIIKTLYIINLIICLSTINAISQSDPTNQSEELGKVNWYRDYGKAIAAAKKEKKGIVILFQEVPGCATCRNYGHNVLSHPLIVEALENSFIPLAIHNNKGGKDKEVLNIFGEPSWNNPVVRIISSSGVDLVKRISGDYSAITLCKRLKEALIINQAPIPQYLNLLELELSTLNSNSVFEHYFSMYCFWSGEKQLGKLNGVLEVESGFINHKEVVKVKYDSKIINKTKLANHAKDFSYKTIVNNNYVTATNDVHYYLQNSDYKYLPLTELQQTKINSALGEKKTGEEYLSPQQQVWLDSLKNTDSSTVLYNKNFETAWVLKQKGI